MEFFSKRHGYTDAHVEITIREDAPESLRVVTLNAAGKHMGAKHARDLVCNVLRKRPDPDNWSDGNIWREVESLVYECPWFKVYDIIEAFAEALGEWGGGQFAEEINECCVEEGIGWQLLKQKIVARGDEGFQEVVRTAASQLQETERPTAASHIQSAVKALSERPRANTSGAVAHATSAVECLLHDITGEAMTLGKYLDKHSGLFHPALKKALDGVYGFASDAGARHGKEGREPSFAEAQFAVTTCAAACTMLTVINPTGQL